MAKEYNRELIKKGILEFPTEFHTFKEDKSMATIIPPFPGLKELGLTNKKCKMIVSIRKENE